MATMTAAKDAAAAPPVDLDKDMDKDAVLPAFLSKTFEIFSRPDFAGICGWNAAGDTIIIHDPDTFVKQVLPRFFKHRNLPSFVRQLNMYGFHKSVLDSNKREFRHKMFLRDKPQLLHLIKRKVNSSAATGATPAATATLLEKQRSEWGEEILNEMKQLKMKSDLMEKRLRDVEIDNAIVRSDNIKLWKQLESAKEKQLVMQEKMKKILWVLFQIYRGKGGQMPKLSTDTNGATIVTAEDSLVSGANRLPPKEFRDVLRYLAMENPPLLQDGAASTDALQLPKTSGKKRKFVEVPPLPALAAVSPPAPAMPGPANNLFEILESTPTASRFTNIPIAPTPKPAKVPRTASASAASNALSLFAPPMSFPTLEKSHSLDMKLPDGSDLHPDMLLAHDDDLNMFHGDMTFGDAEAEDVFKKLDDVEKNLLHEYDATSLDSLLEQFSAADHAPSSATAVVPPVLTADAPTTDDFELLP